MNSVKKLSVILIAAAVVTFNSSAVKCAEPELTAVSAILIEETTGRVLYTKDEHKRMYPASMTKLLTAVVALDYIKPDEMVKIGSEINQVPFGSSVAGHSSGESILFENLLRALIIQSGNESAITIAVNVAKAARATEDLSFSDSMKIFSDLMNDKARAIGANESHFINPHGFHEDGHYTTAHDMALISKAAMENELIRKIAGEKSFKGNGATANNPVEVNLSDLKTKEYTWNSHNLLINSDKYSYPYATGIKTGFTNEASDCLAGSAEKDGEKLISVIFYSPDPARWEDTIKLFDYGFSTYDYEIVSQKDRYVVNMPLSGQILGVDATLDIATAEDYTGYYSKDELDRIEMKITYDESKIIIDDKNTENPVKISAPVLKDDVLGQAVFTLDGETIFETPVVSSRAVEKRSITSDLKYYWQLVTSNIFSLAAVPFWAGGAIVIGIVTYIITNIRKRRSRRFYRLKKRY